LKTLCALATWRAYYLHPLTIRMMPRSLSYPAISTFSPRRNDAKNARTAQAWWIPPAAQIVHEMAEAGPHKTSSNRNPRLKTLCGLAALRADFFEFMGDTPQAGSDQRHLEVDEQTKAPYRQPEISQKLLVVNRSNQLDRLDFHDDLYQLRWNRCRCRYPCRPQIGCWHIARRTRRAQFVRQDRLVNRLQEA